MDTRIWIDDHPADLHDAAPGKEIDWVSCDPGVEDGAKATIVASAGDTYIRIAYDDGIAFIVNQSGSDIWVTRPAAASIEDVSTYLLGPILGVVLLLRGTICFHASAAVIDGQAAAFAGSAGAGKSTTAALLAQRGYEILTDDLLPLVDRGESFAVQPGYAQIRLWPESVAILFGSRDALPRIVPLDSLDPAWDKRFFDVLDHGGRFASEPVPLRAMYLLGERSGSGDVPRIDPVSPRCGLLSLISNTYASRYIGKTMRGRQFDVLGRLFASITLRTLTPHRDPRRIDEYVELILSDLAALPPALRSGSTE